jgi:hypothetical protein
VMNYLVRKCTSLDVNLQTQHTFKCVFAENASQKAVFDAVALPLAEDVLHGKNGEIDFVIHL